MDGRDPRFLVTISRFRLNDYAENIESLWRIHIEFGKKRIQNNSIECLAVFSENRFVQFIDFVVVCFGFVVALCWNIYT